MRTTLDRRVVPEDVIALVLACQQRVPCHLAGGAALAGAYLGHRLSGDVDLFCHDADAVRTLVRELDSVAQESGSEIAIVRDAGTFVRAHVRRQDARGTLDLDIVHEPVRDVEPPPPPLDGVVVESLADLRASKLTCILSRSEPRDLVDLLFLERAGYPPEHDIALALRKDGGIDPAILAWLLSQFPLEPLPRMLAPLTPGELRAYRDDLAARFRRLAVPPEDGR